MEHGDIWRRKAGQKLSCNMLNLGNHILSGITCFLRDELATLALTCYCTSVCFGLFRRAFWIRSDHETRLEQLEKFRRLTQNHFNGKPTEICRLEQGGEGFRRKEHGGHSDRSCVSWHLVAKFACLCRGTKRTMPQVLGPHLDA